VDKLSTTVKDLLKHSNAQASDLQAERSLNQSLQSSRSTSPGPMSPQHDRSLASPKSTPGSAFTNNTTMNNTSMSSNNGSNDLQERLEQEERKVKNLQETNKVLIQRLNETRAELNQLKK
jgi:hypothetical protein